MDQEFEKPTVSVDIVLFGIDFEIGVLKVLLVKRGEPPFQNCWALPGGRVKIHEALDTAAFRELKEESGVKLGRLYLEQLYTFGHPARDPRGRVISVAFFGLMRPSGAKIEAGTDAAEVGWFPVAEVPKLAFDHKSILTRALERLRTKIKWQPVGFELLPPEFTLSMVQRLYEIILDRKLDRRNFQKKILSFGFLEETGRVLREVAHRPAKLYKYNHPKAWSLGDLGIPLGD